MPRWLRQFTFNQINDFYKKESEEAEKVSQRKNPNSSTLVDSSGKINKDAWKSVQKPMATSGPSKVKYK